MKRGSAQSNRPPAPGTHWCRGWYEGVKSGFRRGQAMGNGRQPAPTLPDEDHFGIGTERDYYSGSQMSVQVPK